MAAMSNNQHTSTIRCHAYELQRNHRIDILANTDHTLQEVSAVCYQICCKALRVNGGAQISSHCLSD